MQHRRLKRDVEIVILDGMDPFSQERFLPRGLLRDSPKRLQSADFIVFTHVKDQTHYDQLQKMLDRYTRAPSIATQIEVLSENNTFPHKVAVFCGIGAPHHFLQTVRDLKSEIVETLLLRDHEFLQADSLQKFAENCRKKGAELLLCTEKDAVKLPSNVSACLKIKPIAIQLKITAGTEHWEKLIENILDRIVK